MASTDSAPARPEQEYLAFLARGRFTIQRSRDRHVFHPRVAEPGSGDADLEWVPASGTSTVYASTVVRQRPSAPDYKVVLVARQATAIPGTRETLA